MNRRQFGRIAAILVSLPLAACVGTGYGPGYGFAPQQQERRYALASDVLFDFNSATLRPGAAGALAQTLSEIRGVYPYPAVRVEGYTDSIGSAQFNQGLSLRRAESVRQFLLSQGIPPNAITPQGFGETNPIAPNTTPDGRDNPAGRQQNRRVVLIATPYQGS